MCRDPCHSQLTDVNPLASRRRIFLKFRRPIPDIGHSCPRLNLLFPKRQSASEESGSQHSPELIARSESRAMHPANPVHPSQLTAGIRFVTTHSCKFDTRFHACMIRLKHVDHSNSRPGAWQLADSGGCPIVEEGRAWARQPLDRRTTPRSRHVRRLRTKNVRIPVYGGTRGKALDASNRVLRESRLNTRRLVRGQPESPWPWGPAACLASLMSRDERKGRVAWRSAVCFACGPRSLLWSLCAPGALLTKETPSPRKASRPRRRAAIVSPIEEAIALPAEEALGSVLEALKAYQGKYGRYPKTLDDLVQDALLAKTPELPLVTGSIDSGLAYRASELQDFFMITFHYKISLSQSTYRDIVEIRRIFVSGNRRSWFAPDTVFVSMADLIADRLASRWRRARDAESLRRFVTEGVKALDCEFLLQSRVVGWLGKGTQTASPMRSWEKTGQGSATRPKTIEWSVTFLIYKPQWFGQFTCPSVDGTVQAAAKGPILYRNHPVLEKLFRISQDSRGKEVWELIRACPPSNRDRRPRPGPGSVIVDDSRSLTVIPMGASSDNGMNFLYIQKI